MKNLVNLSNKCFLVTGASSGIGKATSILLSQLGADVILISRNKQNLETTLLAMEGSNHIVISFDLTESSRLDILLDKIAVFTKKIDGIVHCAGLQISEPLRFIEEDSMRKILQLNIIAPTMLTKVIRKGRLFNRNSSIVFLSSVLGLTGGSGAAIYAASKSAIMALTKSMAVEFVGDGMRVNCIVPAVVKTPMLDGMVAVLGKEHIETIEKKHLLGFGEPDDVASMIAFLLSDATKWITGSCVVVDGGYSLNI